MILPEHIRHVPTRTVTGTALDLSTAALSAGPEIHQAYQQALFAIPQHLLSSGYLPGGYRLCANPLPGITANADYPRSRMRLWWSMVQSAGWR